MTTVTGTAAAQSAADIKRQISAAFAEYLDADNKRAMAKHDADAANENSLGKRGTLMTRLADAATKHAWSGDDVKDAVVEIVKAYAGNDKKKASSVSTFKSEVLVACDRKVRPHVEPAFRLAREAIEREIEAKAADDKAPTPVKKAFARQHHAAVAVLKAIRDGSNVTIGSIEDLTRFAIDTIRARQIDYERVKKRLDAIRAELGEFYDDFPVDGIQVCMEFLKEITTDELKDARRTAGAEDATEDAPEDDDDAQSEVAPEVEPTAPKTIGDHLDDALADIYEAAA
jgi:hypothetical protein